MNWDAIGAIGEIVGALAVLLTLFYLANQVRQSNKATQAGIESQMGQWWSQHNREMLLAPDMLEVIETALKDVKSLSDPDRRRFSWWIASTFYVFQDLHRQFERGVLSEEAWVTNEMAIDGLIRNPAVAIWWDSGFFQATREFTQYVDSLRTKPDSSWQWVDIARKYDDA
jgi:hypothetical protein